MLWNLSWRIKTNLTASGDTHCQRNITNRQYWKQYEKLKYLNDITHCALVTDSTRFNFRQGEKLLGGSASCWLKARMIFTCKNVETKVNIKQCHLISYVRLTPKDESRAGTYCSSPCVNNTVIHSRERITYPDKMNWIMLPCLLVRRV